ncbi:MAG: DUF72 domain-containing protein [Acidobacteria bacterium]|nr:DUF72 domain-containing protein [Acidobacteriota bacterium]MCA1649441.1 DUF72 domain-containing protein [Acidobacteriota bacterium]
MSEIRVGTSGWNYPSGKGTWNGIFYPVTAQSRRRTRGIPKFDELAFYAEHFNTVEINSTFYGVPAPATAKAWAARTPPGFEFSLKLYQKFTHPEMFQKATGADPWDLGTKDVDQFRAAIDPLADAGKLGALLAQFPASFRNEPDNRGYLEWLLERFRDYQLAVELRHRTWSDSPVETLELLSASGSAWAQIDEPKFRFSIRQNLLPNVRTFYYLRLHGRNAADWWAHDKSEDRYNYLYSAGELEPFADAAREASREVKKAYLYANNHFSAKSVANAAILKHQLGQDLPGGYPEEFVERYPDLKGIVKVLPALEMRPSDTPS